MVNQCRVVIPLVVTVLVAFSLTGFAQASKQERKIEKHDPFYAEVIKSLDPLNPMRLRLEMGDRGHGPHYFWMDEMKARGIKQVHFEVGFKWYGDIIRVKVERVLYLRQYFEMLKPIADAETLDSITGSDLELQLKAEAESRAYDEAMMWKSRSDQPKKACGTIFKDLFDDERLPMISTELADIRRSCAEPK